MKSFQPPILIQRTAFPITKGEVNKLDLSRIYLCMVLNWGDARTYNDVFGNWREVNINFSPV